MATLLLGAAGSLIGGALLGPIGAVAGRALGALGGAVLDQTLIGGARTPKAEGPRLSDLDVMASTEGAPVARLYGRARLPGQVIWATKLREVRREESQSVAGKGGSLAPKVTTYTYYANFAVAFCEGPVTRIGRIWADGKPLDQRRLLIRTHLGGEDQAPDAWIAAKQSEAGTPAYRGIAYLVFQVLDLTDFGNRIPQITAEVERPVGALEGQIRAVTLIPGATEFGYDPLTVRQQVGEGAFLPESRHVTTHPSDFEAALEQLRSCCPNLARVSLVVSWFGDDLRAGACAVRPRSERLVKATTPVSWAVGGDTRLTVPEVSRFDGRAAYGGTPDDGSVLRAIRRLKQEGIKVTLNPFVMMDIPADNARPDPWTGAAAQPAHPWRGRIVCDPAPGRPGSVDGTAACAAQVAALFGTAQGHHFTRLGDLVLYCGPAEWSLRRMALHYAHLAVAAGGVEAILIGSEFEALTRLRDHTGAFPAAQALADLAAEVKAVVGADTLVSYAANWSEYGAQAFDGGDLRFPLDAVWASPAVDFIGIDYYPPMADWREGSDHRDAALARAPYEAAYLKANLRAGEGYDWFYADEAARRVQERTPIADGAYGEPWVFRQKDLWSFWANAHYERAGGVRHGAPTAYAPGAKPIRLMEAGCPAVDKGPNRPSVFPDPKSSENALPPFSTGARDDLVQRRALGAILSTFEPAAGASLADNPPAALYDGRMVEAGCTFLWTFDARPYPQFPLARAVWADGANWHTGHWLNGRLGGAPLDGLVARLCADFGIDGVDAAALSGAVDGYVVERPMSARAAIEPLARAFGFEAAEAGATIAFRPRGRAAPVALNADDLVRTEDRPLVTFTRAQESELPAAVRLGFIDAHRDYRRVSLTSRRLVGGSRHEVEADLAVVAETATMARAADIWLQDLWTGRETAAFTLAPSRLALVPGDLVRLALDGREHLWEITRVEEAEARAVSARAIDPEVFDAALAPEEDGAVALPPPSGPPAVALLSLPAESAAEPVPLQYLAAAAEPWPGTLAVWRSGDGASFEAIAALTSPAVFGTLLDALAPGPLWRFDRFQSVRVATAALVSASEAQVLDGANMIALFAEGRDCDILQFTEAQLLEEGVFRLGGLLRGRAGTELAGAELWPAGTRLVKLDGRVEPVASGLSMLGRSFLYRVGPGRGDQGDEEVSEVAGTVEGTALRPLYPVHARARRTGEGVALSFVRRTRTEGDGWEQMEVPLGEAREAYRLEILDGADVVRAFETETPAVLYPAAAESADFGAPQATLTVRIAQLSAAVGAGAARVRTLSVA
ncbi:glycoside hydrolase/phage tail family protein [Xanthobacter sp. KR7-225]|uniref:baseplate multidomain protein megatron n=1 Tax=Xanthobacter sp. KR7-225 TaxID=3156613 RepID=UPI0032B4619E